MRIRDLIKSANLKTIIEGKDFVVKSGITCDLLSIVMSSAKEDSIWITVQKHLNIVAVAALREIKAIVITSGIRPEKDVIDRAKEERIWILTTDEDSFTISGKIFNLLHHDDKS